MKLTTTQKDRAAGVLLASAAGDALGAGYEFTYPSADAEIGMIGGGLGFAPSEWTDDTSMAVGIAQVTATGADLREPAALDAVAANWVRWYDSHPADIGNQTRNVLSHRDKTAAAMTETARRVTGRKAGNGSLMRTAPVALAYLDQPAAAVEAAAMVSTLTHDDPRAAEACQLWTFAIRHAVEHGNFDGVRGFLLTAESEVAEFWGKRLDEAEAGSPADFPKNGWVVHALQTAWSAIHNTPADGPLHLQRSLEACVRAGWDTDTTAAIAGGLLGARWGASAVPARWRRKLHGYPGLVGRDLVTLAVHTVQGGHNDEQGWPGEPHVDDSEMSPATMVPHPHDSGVLLGNIGAVQLGGFDAIVSLCRMGSEILPVEDIEFWLIDKNWPENPNLEFILDDAAQTVQTLRAEGKRVLLHCVGGRSRTPSVGARYSMLLGKDPWDVRTAMTWAHPREQLWAAATRSG